MFLLSDSILGLRKFVLADPPAWLEGAVMATYCSAQFLLADGAARAGAHCA
ncbi:lysoplasmalogenase family protein [Tsukamurella sp. PLM1]|uniref:lysoplasmalogenase family protein n=1 Tax=Tsukamurella sp. PLM1 TaxID=2929795 RepID=UPI00211322CB|nr:lysoplasmalogenase family protein [Tsukamurella sp. PLM1]